MRRLIYQILAGILGLFLAIKLFSGIEFNGSWKILILAGLILGLINFFIKPVLKLITLPLRILTFGLFGLIINIGIIWIIDLIFPGLKISGFLNLFWTTILVWGSNLILLIFLPK